MKFWQLAVACVLCVWPIEQFCAAQEVMTLDGRESSLRRISARERYNIPSNADSFLAETLGVAKSTRHLRPKDADEDAYFDASITKADMDSLMEKFREAFPEIHHINYDWDNDDVNAWAWVDIAGDRHVLMLGGMIRHRFNKMQAVAIVLAHEVGHHLGGNPKYPGGLTCEGMADFWGTKHGLRRVYNGSDSAADTDEYKALRVGVDQLYAVLTGGLRVNPYSEEGVRLALESERITKMAAATNRQEAIRCGHPDADCRYRLYVAGFNKDDEPPACHATPGAFDAALPDLPTYTPFSEIIKMSEKK